MMKHQVYHLWEKIIETQGIDFMINQHRNHDQDPHRDLAPGLQPRKVVENTQKEKQ